MENLKEIFEEFKKRIKNSNALDLPYLEKWKNDFLVDIDKQIDEIYEKKENLKILFLRRLELKKYKVGIFRQLLNLKVKQAISAPFIYSMIIPLMFTDLFLETYHQVCFPLYGIPLVDRKLYISYDRRLLSYLNWFEKLNCLYCSYANGLIAYAREIAACTERYWCPIKYSHRIRGEHSHYHLFNEFLDGENYHKRLEELRNFSKCDFK